MHFNIFAYLRYKYPSIVDSLTNIPVVELSEQEWKEGGLTGYGYTIRQQDINDTASQMSGLEEEQLEQVRMMYPEAKRDLFIYDIYNKLNQAPFFLIKEGNEAAIVHEVAHDIWSRFSDEERSNIQLPNVTPQDDDEYLQSESERFTHMSEMEYFKSQGVLFLEYFKQHNPNEHSILSDPNADPQQKRLALMDFQDYQSIWNQTKASNFGAENWFTKIAQTLVLQESTHNVNNRPIYYITGPTYSIRRELGRNGLGFTWYGARKMWWMYKERLNDRVIQGLNNLGINTAITGAESAAPAIPGAEPIATEPVTPMTSGLTDQSWDDVHAKSRWYGFPIKSNIYSTTVPIEVEGQQIEITVTLSRVFRKGRRRIPSYRYDIAYNGKTVGRLAKAAPTNWGKYNEDEIAQNLPELVQGQLSKREKSKTYNNIKYIFTVSGRDPELTQYLQTFDDHDSRAKINKSIHLDEPGYEGDYPVKIYTYQSNANWYGETALEHPMAPSPKTIFFLQPIPPEVHSMDQFNQWLDQELQQHLPRAQKGYLEYLQSFAFTEDAQAEAAGQFQEVLPIIESKSRDLNHFRQKMMEMGYVRPSRRRRRGSPGMQLQDDIVILLDSKKIVNDSYKMGALSNSPEFFYTAVAYHMHRQKAGNIGFGAAFGPLGNTVRDFHTTLKRHGATIDLMELYDYIENLSSFLLNKLIGVQARGSAWDQQQAFYGNGGFSGGTETVPTDEALGAFIQFAVQHGSNEAVAQENPKRTFKELAFNLHPDKNPENETIFKELTNLWSRVPNEYKVAGNWLGRLCMA